MALRTALGINRAGYNDGEIGKREARLLLVDDLNILQERLEFCNLKVLKK